MMEKDRVSVIVPVYKVEPYLARCIESIQKQTYLNLEIILVDDGSPDRCGDICESYAAKDDRIHVIHKQNGGLSDARNAGIEYASGSYICFADSDDWLDRDMISLLYSICTKRKADIAECSYRNIFSGYTEEETSCTARIIEGDSIFALEKMLEWKYFKPVVWNKLYKRSVIGDIRYPVGKLHEDEYVTYKLFYNAGKSVYVDVSKYNYDRTRTDSITGDAFKEDNLDACWAFRERMDFFREHHLDMLEKKINNMYCWQVLRFAYKCYQTGTVGKKVERLIEQVASDITYLECHKVDTYYIDEFKILKNGIDSYGKYREERETG